MAMMTAEEWKELRSLPRWTPLRSLRWRARHVAGALYAIGDNGYVIAQPFGPDLKKNHPDAPFVVAAYWAASEGAALRVVSSRHDSDDMASAAPPSALCPGPGQVTYDAILRAGRSAGMGGFAEQAVYAGDGRFVHKTLWLPFAHYFFRQLEVEPGEMPYAIQLILPQEGASR